MQPIFRRSIGPIVSLPQLVYSIQQREYRPCYYLSKQNRTSKIILKYSNTHGSDYFFLRILENLLNKEPRSLVIVPLTDGAVATGDVRPLLLAKCTAFADLIPDGGAAAIGDASRAAGEKIDDARWIRPAPPLRRSGESPPSSGGKAKGRDWPFMDVIVLALVIRACLGVERAVLAGGEKWPLDVFGEVCVGIGGDCEAAGLDL